MQMKIAVAGATGRVGTHIVDLLEQDGHEVVRMSRATGVDVVTGEGLAEALKGVDVLVDAATGPSPDEKSATDFFTASARNLQAAALEAGVQRIVLISIIGIDRFSSGYNAAKVAQERAMLLGPIPVQILRAAQFHEFVGELLDWGTQGDVGYVWAMKTQLVAARTVAEAAVRMAVGEDEARLREVAGPREERMVEAARLIAARRGAPARVEVAPVDPSDPDAEKYASGAALPGPDATLAGPTFQEWLDRSPVTTS